jgi:hypothetical protein
MEISSAKALHLYILLIANFLLQKTHAQSSSSSATSNSFTSSSDLTAAEIALPTSVGENYMISTGHGPVVMSTTASGIVVDTSNVSTPTMRVTQTQTGSASTSSNVKATASEGLGSSSEGQKFELGKGGFS